MGSNCLALDIGASSGRLMLGKYDGEKIELVEIHRFENSPLIEDGRVYWNFENLVNEVKVGLKKASKLNLTIETIETIGVDTWGVDYGFLDKHGKLMGNPMHYRDNRTLEILDKIKSNINYEEIYNITGIQYMNFNTLFQLISDCEIRNEVYKNAETFLMIPDLFNYFLSGKKVNEYTEATTSQIIDPKTKSWNKELIERLNLRSEIFCDIVMPGTILGELKRELQEEVNLNNIKVIAVGSHDTASAVVGAPLEDKNSAFLSCGTWSLMGMELKEAIISKKSMEYGFTNEGGAENTITYLKNITGLWILQELRKHLSISGKKITFPEIVEAAKRERHKKFIIDVNAKEFLFPDNMANAISNYCETKGQGTPKTVGELAIAFYNGISLEYNKVIKNLEEVTSTTIDTINMVGGGIQDELLCEMLSISTGKTVVAGPIEASVLGNVLMQLIATGVIKDVNEGREIVKKSFHMKIYKD